MLSSFDSHDLLTNDIIDLDPHSDTMTFQLPDGLQVQTLSHEVSAPNCSKGAVVQL